MGYRWVQEASAGTTEHSAMWSQTLAYLGPGLVLGVEAGSERAGKDARPPLQSSGLGTSTRHFCHVSLADSDSRSENTGSTSG